jgi:hypothetical protein
LITGEGPSYANASVAYEVQQQRYVFFRNIIETWLINKVFLPVSIQHGFKDTSGKYKVPQIRWRRMDFMKDTEWRRAILDLNKSGEGGTPKVSTRTVLTELGLDYDEEQELIMTEKIAELERKKKMKDIKQQSGGMEGGLLGGMGGGLGGDLGGGLGGGLGGEIGGAGGLGGEAGVPPNETGFEGAGAPPPMPGEEGAAPTGQTTFSTPAI